MERMKIEYNEKLLGYLGWWAHRLPFAALPGKQVHFPLEQREFPPQMTSDEQGAPGGTAKRFEVLRFVDDSHYNIPVLDAGTHLSSKATKCSLHRQTP
uniref:Uncharacterized protein n=1 Tax=Romanomermis culicivorax TaxID=13658 RepID=A0A915I616_ROMCU